MAFVFGTVDSRGAEYRHTRDTVASQTLKLAHRSKCQFCGSAFNLPDGPPYAEGHHIKPLGHSGPDNKANLICFFPNQHAVLAYFVMRLDQAKLRQASGQTIAQRFIDYHNARFPQRRAEATRSN